MKKIKYEDVNAWSVMYFEIDDNRYDLTFLNDLWYIDFIFYMKVLDGK